MNGRMKLPNGDHAIVEIGKLLEYCLNSQHPRGRNKARVFASVGIREADGGRTQDGSPGGSRQRRR